MVDICQEDRSQRSAPQRRHTAHLRQHYHCTPRKLSGWDRAVIRHIAPLGECAHQAPGRLSCSDLWMAQNTGPTKSVPLWSTQEPEPEWLRPGKCTQPRAHFTQFPCRATWSLSSVDWESTHAVIRGKPTVIHTLWVLPTHASEFFVVFFPPHSTAEQVSLNKRPLRPLVLEWKLNIEETYKQKKPNEQRELLYKWQVQQIKIPVVNTDYIGKGV